MSGFAADWITLEGPVPYVAELKIDGLSIALQYQDGAPGSGRDPRRRHDR